MIVEGILILANPELENYLMKYTYMLTDERLIRRMKRDIVERGRDMHEVINRYQNTLKPMHEQFIEPTKLLLISLYQTTIQHRSHRCGSSSNKPKFYKLVVILKHTIIRAISLSLQSFSIFLRQYHLLKDFTRLKK
jgi:uridine kinase